MGTTCLGALMRHRNVGLRGSHVNPYPDKLEHFRLTVFPSPGPPQQQGCVTRFTSGDQIGNCQSLDARCICQDQNFLSGIACCLVGTCNQADTDAAVQFAIQFCSSLGVTVPTAATCNTATPSATGSSSAAAPSGTAGTDGSATTTAPAPAGTSSNAAAVAGAGSGLGLVGGLVAAVALL